jgi:hypothetical protein
MNATLSAAPRTASAQPQKAAQTKHCSACDTDHPIADFAINGHSSRQSQCKLTRRRYIAAHYAKNRSTHIARVNSRAAKLQSHLYEALMALPRPSKCAACNKALPTKKKITPRERPVALRAGDLTAPSVNSLIHANVSTARIEAIMETELTWVHRPCIARLRTNVATP